MLETTAQPRRRVTDIFPTRQTMRPRLDDMIAFTVTSGGVTLHIDADGEDYYLEATIDHDPVCLLALTELAYSYELEFMPEAECEPQIGADGSVRVYMVDATIDVPVIPCFKPVPLSVA